MPDGLRFDAAAAEVCDELHIQQQILSDLPESRTHWTLLTLLSHGLRQFQWLKGQCRLNELGRATKSEQA
jgi:hypothetical protein